MDGPPLPLLKPPPPHLIAVRGAQRLRVMNVDDPDPRRRNGHTETIALAWAQIPGGGWAVLLAWIGVWQQNSRTTGRGRYGWCRILDDRVRAMPAVHRPGVAWYGWAQPNELDTAIEAAAATLPEHLRAAALEPWCRNVELK